MSINETQKSPKKLRAKQVSQMYGVGLSTVWHYKKKGLLKSYNITPRVTVFDAQEVEAFFNGGAHDS